MAGLELFAKTRYLPKISSMHQLRLILFTLYWLILTNTVKATYYPLECSGTLPASFEPNYFQRALENFETYKDSLPQGHSGGARKYYWSNQYFLKKLILSGDVIYGDPISLELQKEADKIRQELGLSSSPQIFLLRSPEPNAFATQTGAIFFTTALISYMDNFHQVLYILCHEMVHVEMNHLYQEFLDEREFKYTHSWRKLDQLIDLYYVHSVQTEFEADRIGFHYFTSMHYEKSMAIESLGNLDSSQIWPFYPITFDSTIDLNHRLPDLVVSKYAVRPFMNAWFDSGRTTHPDFILRYDSLREQSIDNYATATIDADKYFEELKEIATNETLLSYFENQRYFSIIAYNLLGDHTFCNQDFLDFLYTKSLYGLLKTRMHLASERAKYDPKKIIVEYDGPLQDYLDIAEPEEYYGVERPFVAYFKNLSLSDHWFIGVQELLNCSSKTSYFENNTSFFQEYVTMFDSLQIDTCKSSKRYDLYLNAKRQLDSLHLLKQKKSSAHSGAIICLLAPYYKEPKESDLDQSKVNLDLYDKVIMEAISAQIEKNSLPFSLYAAADLNTTEKYRDYLALRSILSNRFYGEEYDCYATCITNKKFSDLQMLRYMRVYDSDGGLAMYSIDLELNSGKLSNETYVEMRTSDDTNGKIESVVKKYLKRLSSK